MSKIRLNLDMTTKQAVLAMSGGNPGALATCMAILNGTATIDPDCIMGGIFILLALDEKGIYEHRLYMLWNDVCKRDVAKLLAVLRAHQLGELAGVTLETLNHAIDNRGEGLDLTAIMAAVQKELPNFNKMLDTPV